MASHKINEEFWSDYAQLYNHFTMSYQSDMLADIAQKASGKIADFGTGVGKLYPHLSKNHNISEVTAFDSNPHMLKFARQRAKQYLSHIPVSIEERDLSAKTIGEIPDRFDSIYMINTLYSNNNPISLINSSIRKLNPDGQIIIIDMARNVNGNQLLSHLEQEWENDPNLEDFIKANKLLMGSGVPSTYTISELESIINLSSCMSVIESSSDYYLGNANYILAKKN